MSQTVVERLRDDFRWSNLTKKGNVFRKLILTANSYYRRDMKTTQRVGKGKNCVKFQFQNKVGTGEHRFVIETGLIDLRLAWVTEPYPEDDTKSVDYFEVSGRDITSFRIDVDHIEELIVDQSENTLNFMRVLYPPEAIKAIDLLEKFNYALDNIKYTLEVRFR